MYSSETLQQNQFCGITLEGVNCEEIVFHRKPLALGNLCVHTCNLVSATGEVAMHPTRVVPFMADVVDLNSSHKGCHISCLYQKHAIIEEMVQKTYC